MTVPEDIISTAIGLLRSGGAPLWAVIALALAAAIVLVMVKRVKLPPMAPMPPAPDELSVPENKGQPQAPPPDGQPTP